jgi:hypothetical protein
MTGVKRIMRKEDEWGGESNRRDQIDMGVETHVEARPHVQSHHSQSLPFTVFESCCIQLASSSSRLHFFCPSEAVLTPE